MNVMKAEELISINTEHLVDAILFEAKEKGLTHNIAEINKLIRRSNDEFKQNIAKNCTDILARYQGEIPSPVETKGEQSPAFFASILVVAMVIAFVFGAVLFGGAA